MGVGAKVGAKGVGTLKAVAGASTGGEAFAGIVGGTEGGRASGEADVVDWGSRLRRRVARVLSCVTSLGERGASGVPVVGLRRAWMISLAPARMRSVEVAMGIGTRLGNQERVSVMRSRCEDQTHTRKQR